MATPLKFTADVKATIVGYLRTGCYLETAASAAGIDPWTLREWLKRGAHGEEPFVDFSREVGTIMAQSEALLVGRVNVASKEDWKAGAWLLERRHARRWQSRVRVEVEQELSAVADRLEAGLPPEVFAQVQALLQAPAHDEAFAAPPSIDSQGEHEGGAMASPRAAFVDTDPTGPAAYAATEPPPPESA